MPQFSVQATASVLGYVATIFLIGGFVLLLAGTGILDIKAITIAKGRKTIAVSILMVLLGVGGLLFDMIVPPTSTTTPVPPTEVAGVTFTPTATPALPTSTPTSTPLPAATPVPPPATPVLPTNTPTPPLADPWGQVVVPPGGTVNLAFVGALSGEMALFGEVQKKAFLMAIEDAVTVKGFSIDAPIIADDGCLDRSIGKQAADTVVSSSSIVGVIGHSCSASCDEGAAVYEKARLAVISPSCTWAALTEHGFQVFNRVAIPYDQGEDDPNRQVVNTSAYHEFANRYQSHYDRYIPEGVWGGEWYAAYAYDATAVLIQAIEQVAVMDGAGNLVIGQQALANAVRATSGYRGVTGVISFDSKGDRLP